MQFLDTHVNVSGSFLQTAQIWATEGVALL